MAIPKEKVFPVEEFERRQTRVRESMAARGIEVLITHAAPNVYYLCGHQSLNLWDYQCLVLPLEAEPFMVLWQFERGRFEASAMACGVELYELLDDPVEKTVEALRKRGLAGKSIGLEPQGTYLSPAMYARVAAALSGGKVVDGSRLIELVRLVKSDAELKLMRKAARFTDDAMEVGFHAIREGVSDSEVCAAAAASMIRNDSFAFAAHPMVAAGYRSGMPHNTNSGRRIRRGETVFLEYSPTIHWYNCPLMRTAVVGEPRPKVLDFAKRAAATVETMIERMRPGVLASEVAEAGKKMIAPIRDQILFHETYGYPVGIGFPPSWLEPSGFLLVVNNHRPLAPGMVFHIPMTHRINGEWGVGLSHTVVVTERGAKVMSRLPLELRVVGGRAPKARAAGRARVRRAKGGRR